MTLVQKLKKNMSLPVIGAPMFIVGNPDLVIAQCASGIIGSFPALNARPADRLDGWLEQIESGLAACRAANPLAKVAPYAVNQIIHQSNDRLDHDLDGCFLGVADRNDIMENGAAVFMHPLHHVVGRAQAGDNDRHLAPGSSR